MTTPSLDCADDVGSNRSSVNVPTRSERGARSRQRVCVLGLGGGGFHFEVEHLLSQMDGDLELVTVYVIASQATANWSSRFPVHRAFVVRSPGRLDGVLKRAWLTVRGVWGAAWILIATKPDCVIAVGTVQTVPFGIAARALGVPLLFIESITRVNETSRTSLIVSRLKLAMRLYVQWEHLATPQGAIYAGSIIS